MQLVGVQEGGHRGRVEEARLLCGGEQGGPLGRALASGALLEVPTAQCRHELLTFAEAASPQQKPLALDRLTVDVRAEIEPDPGRGSQLRHLRLELVAAGRAARIVH